MHKLFKLTMICLTLCFCNTVIAFAAYGEMSYADSIIYINGRPIQGYSTGYENEYYYVFSEDLPHCGFNVLFNEQMKELSIKRISGKQAESISNGEYAAIIQNNNATQVPIDYFRSYINVTIDNIPWVNGSYHFRENGCFIPVDHLAELYGRKEYDSTKNITYIYIDSDTPISRTRLSPIAFRAGSLNDYIAAKRKDGNYEVEFYEEYIRLEYITVTSDNDSITTSRYNYHTVYAPVAYLAEKYGLKCNFTEDEMIISPGQSNLYYAISKHADRWNDDKTYFNTPYGDEDYIFACVDLKLVSGDKMFTNDDLLPVFISYNGELHMRLDKLAEAVNK